MRVLRSVLTSKSRFNKATRGPRLLDPISFLKEIGTFFTIDRGGVEPPKIKKTRRRPIAKYQTSLLFYASKFFRYEFPGGPTLRKKNYLPEGFTYTRPDMSSCWTFFKNPTHCIALSGWNGRRAA